MNTGGRELPRSPESIAYEQKVQSIRATGFQRAQFNHSAAFYIDLYRGILLSKARLMSIEVDLVHGGERQIYETEGCRAEVHSSAEEKTVRVEMVNGDTLDIHHVTLFPQTRLSGFSFAAEDVLLGKRVDTRTAIELTNLYLCRMRDGEEAYQKAYLSFIRKHIP